MKIDETWDSLHDLGFLFRVLPLWRSWLGIKYKQFATDNLKTSLNNNYNLAVTIASVSALTVKVISSK